MLAQGNRLRDSEIFRLAVRRGTRAGNSDLVVHAWTGEEKPERRLVGFIVSKQVSKRAVERNRIKRQLRHLVRERLDDLPADVIVVRAQPGILGASYQRISASLDRGLAAVAKRLPASPRGSAGSDVSSVSGVSGASVAAESVAGASGSRERRRR